MQPVAPRTTATQAIFALALMTFTPAALGQGTIIIDEPIVDPHRPARVTASPLVLTSQRISAEITDGVAVTTVRQTFRNPLHRAIEGTYVFPLPDAAAVGEFEMTMSGRTLKGEVLERDKAREIYEGIVRKMRDPALLEFLGARLYQARVFPIPPGETVELKLAYSTTLRESGGLGLFQHPFACGSAASGEIGELFVQVRLTSQKPLTSVFVPSHPCDIRRLSDHEASVTYEARNVVMDRDFSLYYQRRDAHFGVSVLAHRPAGEAGYFLLRISPRVELEQQQVLPKDIAFVVDTSGSMQGEKMEQLRRALKMCIDSLGPEDRFNIYAFSTDVRSFRESLVSADTDTRQAAREFANGLAALGGTNIHGALSAALAADTKDEKRPYLVVFMTDGMPTVDITNPDALLKSVEQKNTNRVRFHVLGVGSQVNTHLLDKLAEINRGTREYCTEKEDLEIKMGAFVGRLSSPVMTDLRVQVDGLSLFDVYPKQIPDLFRGNDLLVLGRYEGGGPRAVRLVGRVGGEEVTFVEEATFPERSAENDFLPPLWANRKVAYLLDEIRLNGESSELKEEVIRLAKRFAIVTPYTASLIVEDERQLAGLPLQRGGRVHLVRPADAAAGAGDLAVGGAGGRGFAPTGGAIAGGAGGRVGGNDVAGASVGEAAVEASMRLREARGRDTLAPASASTDLAWVDESRQALPLRRVGDKLFIEELRRFVDVAWDRKQETRKLRAFSDEYFELIRKHPEARRCFALGERVIVVIEGVAYETVADESAQTAPAADEPAQTAPAAPKP